MSEQRARARVRRRALAWLAAVLLGPTAPLAARETSTQSPSSLPRSAAADRGDGRKQVFQGKNLLFVAASDSASAASDGLVRAHLESLGFVVISVGGADPAAPAEGGDVVVISSSVRRYDTRGRYKHTPVPIVTWGSDLLDDLGMTGGRLGLDFGDDEKARFLWMVNAPHSLSARLPAGTLDVYRKIGRMGWGRPGLGATIIATLPGQPEKATLFAYRKGATMDGDFLAPAPRVFLFFQGESFENLNGPGVALFDGALRWTLLKPKED